MRQSFFTLGFVLAIVTAFIPGSLYGKDGPAQPAELSLTLDQPSYEVGQTITLEVQLANTSQSDLNYLALDLDRQSVSFSVQVNEGQSGTWTRIHGEWEFEGAPVFKPQSFEKLVLNPGNKDNFSIQVPALTAGAWNWQASYNGLDGMVLSSAKVAVEVKPAGDASQALVKLATNQGDILVQLLVEETPGTALNFANAVLEHKYDGLIFHRVIPNFMIQGGDPLGTGEGGPGYYIPFETPKSKHTPGVLSMARMGHSKDTGGSQFFLMHAAYPSLDGEYCAFGKTVSGQEVINAIATTKTEPGDRPVQRQAIDTATIQVGAGK